MDICVSADHKNDIWKLFKTFPSWNCRERLQTTLPYGLGASGLMHATLLFLRHHPPLPWRGQPSCRDVFALGWPLTSFCTFSSSVLQLSPVTHTIHAPSQPGTGKLIRTETSGLFPIPSMFVFSFLIQKLSLEAFRSKQNVYSASAGKFCFISLLKRLFAYLTFFSFFFSHSTPLGVVGWQTLMMLLLLPLPFLHLVHPSAEP